MVHRSTQIHSCRVMLLDTPQESDLNRIENEPKRIQVISIPSIIVNNFPIDTSSRLLRILMSSPDCLRFSTEIENDSRETLIICTATVWSFFSSAFAFALYAFAILKSRERKCEAKKSETENRCQKQRSSDEPFYLSLAIISSCFDWSPRQKSPTKK